MRLLVLWFVLFVCAVEARSEEFVARWQNAPGAPEAATVLVLDLGELTFADIVNCAPGEICTTAYDVDPGEYDARLRVAADGYDLSPYSTVQHIVVEPDPVVDPPPNACSDEPLSVRADLNDDGDVTTLDFGLFMRAFLE